MGVHESQSLLWERMVSLNKPFQRLINSIYVLNVIYLRYHNHINAVNGYILL